MSCRKTKGEVTLVDVNRMQKKRKLLRFGVHSYTCTIFCVQRSQLHREREETNAVLTASSCTFSFFFVAIHFFLSFLHSYTYMCLIKSIVWFERERWKVAHRMLIANNIQARQASRRQTRSTTYKLCALALYLSLS